MLNRILQSDVFPMLEGAQNLTLRSQSGSCQSNEKQGRVRYVYIIDT